MFNKEAPNSSEGLNDFNIPLSNPEDYANPPKPDSVGFLIKNTLEEGSNLIRGELNLFKSEVTKQLTKAGTGAGLWLVALTLVLYSSFFFFFSIAELLDVWLPRWIGFMIVFFLLIIISLILILVGLRLVRRLQVPPRTVASLKETSTLFKKDSNPPATP